MLSALILNVVVLSMPKPTKIKHSRVLQFQGRALACLQLLDLDDKLVINTPAYYLRDFSFVRWGFNIGISFS
jgi:hypothetical protein